MANAHTPGQIQAAMLVDSLAEYKMGPTVGEMTRPLIWGVTPDGSFVDGMTVDGFIAQSGQILIDSGRFYVYGNTIVYETSGPGDRRLFTLAVNYRAEPNAAPILANRLGVASEGKPGEFIQALMAPKLINAILADEALWGGLPEILYYSRRPTFDEDSNLCQPGWNPGAGILSHAPEIVPVFHQPASTEAKAIDRLPPVTGVLLREFNWRSEADLVNAAGMFLTGLLINQFVDDPHPAGLVDANQPGAGKTLLVQVIGHVLDDAEPPRVSLVRDEELEKRLCAQLRSSRSTLYFLDNVKTRIDSPVVEQNMLSPLLSFRILGRAATIERPNTFLWFITSNLTAATTDLIRRCVPIRLFVEGDPKGRLFAGNPLAYAAEHRLEILAELAGMVLRWAQQGKPKGHHKHRCNRWAATIGGILDVNGLGEFFLANADEAESQMDQGLVDLATLAELVVAGDQADLYGPAGGDGAGKGRVPGQWVPLFASAQVLRDKFVDAAPKGKETAVGMFLAGRLNRFVPIETAAGPRRATLRRRSAGSGQKLYFFEIDEPGLVDGPSAGPPPDPATGSPPAPHGDTPTPASPAAGIGGPVGGASATIPDVEGGGAMPEWV